MNKQKSRHKRKQSSRRERQPRLVCPPELQKLKSRCLSPVEAFFDEGEVTTTMDGPLIFKGRGSNVLAVAHLDTVRQDRHFGVYREDSDTLLNCQLDDRLGAWIILDAMPARGIILDVLLTTGEESCNSTAKHFATDKSYNWIVEFDRGGTDVVTYQYNDRSWKDALKSSGNHIGYGSYSDIAELEHLETSAVNWGIGYHNNHARDSYCSISELGDALERFERFHEENHAIRYGHIPTNNWWEEYDEEHAYDCQCQDCQNLYGWPDEDGRWPNEDCRKELDWYENTKEGRKEQREWDAYYNTQNRMRKEEKKSYD